MMHFRKLFLFGLFMIMSGITKGQGLPLASFKNFYSYIKNNIFGKNIVYFNIRIKILFSKKVNTTWKFINCCFRNILDD